MTFGDIGDFIFPYTEDILFASKGVMEHIEHRRPFRSLFEQLTKYGIEINTAIAVLTR